MKFDKHRTGDKPEWESYPPEKRGIGQKMAAKTNGWFGPANLVSFAGTGLFFWGLYDYTQGQKAVGFAKMVGGALFDFADGIVAKWTKTKSPLGEAVDATLDKVKIAGALVVFGVTEVIPVVPLIAVATQNAANVAVTGIAKHRGKEIHAEFANKATPWVEAGLGMGGFVVSDMLAPGTGQHVAEVIGYIGAVGGSIFPGAYGTYELARQAFADEDLPEAA